MTNEYWNSLKVPVLELMGQSGTDMLASDLSLYLLGKDCRKPLINILGVFPDNELLAPGVIACCTGTASLSTASVSNANSIQLMPINARPTQIIQETTP